MHWTYLREKNLVTWGALISHFQYYILFEESKIAVERMKPLLKFYFETFSKNPIMKNKKVVDHLTRRALASYKVGDVQAIDQTALKIGEFMLKLAGTHKKQSRREY